MAISQSGPPVSMTVRAEHLLGRVWRNIRTMPEERRDRLSMRVTVDGDTVAVAHSGEWMRIRRRPDLRFDVEATSPAVAVMAMMAF